MFRFFLTYNVATYIDVYTSVSPNQGIDFKDVDFIPSGLLQSWIVPGSYQMLNKCEQNRTC